MSPEKQTKDQNEDVSETTVQQHSTVFYYVTLDKKPKFSFEFAKMCRTNITGESTLCNSISIQLFPARSSQAMEWQAS